MWTQKPSFRFVIDNFSEKESGIASHTFVSGGCEWYLNVWPKGHIFIGNHFSVYLYVANHKSLGTGWKRTASYYYVALNQSEKELYRSNVEQCKMFRAESPGWGFQKTLSLPKFHEKGFLENDQLIIEVYVKVFEAVDGETLNVSEKKKETVDINGFQVFASQVSPVWKIFAEHPDFAQDFKPKNQVVKAEYMNVILGLINTLKKSPHSLSETELSNAHNELSELTNVGFKLEWLKLKLEEIFLERKKADDANGSLVQQLEERVKILELMDLGSLKSKLEVDSLERKKADDADRTRVQQLEERVKNIELMESSFKLDSLKLKIEEVTLERKKADVDGSCVQQLKERIKNLELMVSDLKVELDKERARSSADGFFLVNEVA